jgi:hypothetical protein
MRARLPPKTKNSILAASRSRKDASLASLHHQPVLCSRPLASASAPALAKSPAPRKRPALPTEARSQVPGARSQEPGARARCQSQVPEPVPEPSPHYGNQPYSSGCRRTDVNFPQPLHFHRPPPPSYHMDFN